jgi:hypothetical protein
VGGAVGAEVRKVVGAYVELEGAEVGVLLSVVSERAALEEALEEGVGEEVGAWVILLLRAVGAAVGRMALCTIGSWHIIVPDCPVYTTILVHLLMLLEHVYASLNGFG